MHSEQRLTGMLQTCSPDQRRVCVTLVVEDTGLVSISLPSRSNILPGVRDESQCGEIPSFSWPSGPNLGHQLEY